MTNPEILEQWQRLGGRCYDVASIKDPHLVPVIEALDYPSTNPVAIDVGSGVQSMASRAQVNGRRLPTAMIDIALSDHGSMIGGNQEFAVDIDSLTAGQEPECEFAIDQYLAEHSDTGEPQADLVVFSDILNYIDYKRALRWFGQRLKLGGFVVIANKPDRGFTSNFSDDGVKTSEELIDFCMQDMAFENYRTDMVGLSGQFLIAAFRKVVEGPADSVDMLD